MTGAYCILCSMKGEGDVSSKGSLHSTTPQGTLQIFIMSSALEEVDH